jgi:hypothetical protein
MYSLQPCEMCKAQEYELLLSSYNNTNTSLKKFDSIKMILINFTTIEFVESLKL